MLEIHQKYGFCPISILEAMHGSTSGKLPAMKDQCLCLTWPHESIFSCNITKKIISQKLKIIDELLKRILWKFIKPDEGKIIGKN